MYWYFKFSEAFGSVSLLSDSKRCLDTWEKPAVTHLKIINRHISQNVLSRHFTLQTHSDTTATRYVFILSKSMVECQENPPPELVYFIIIIFIWKCGVFWICTVITREACSWKNVFLHLDWMSVRVQVACLIPVITNTCSEWKVCRHVEAHYRRPAVSVPEDMHE